MVRLTEHQVRDIKDAVRRVLGDDAKVFIFGSRADPSRRGGDIDVLVKVSRSISAEERFDVKKRLFVEMCKRLGERKIDLLVSGEPESPVEKIAMEEGVEI